MKKAWEFITALWDYYVLRLWFYYFPPKSDVVNKPNSEGQTLDDE